MMKRKKNQILCPHPCKFNVPDSTQYTLIILVSLVVAFPTPSMSIIYGIILLDHDDDNRIEEKFYTTTVAYHDTEDWEAFVKRASALWKTAHLGHAALVRAARDYCTSKNEKARDEAADALWAFMGDDFNNDALGTWTKLKDGWELNNLTIDEKISATFSFVERYGEDY